MDKKDVQAALFSHGLQSSSDLVRQLMTLATGVCAAMFTLVDRAHNAHGGIWLWSISEIMFSLSVVSCYVTMLLDKEMVSNQMAVLKDRMHDVDTIRYRLDHRLSHRLSHRITCLVWVSIGTFVVGGILSGRYGIVTREIR